MIIEQIDNSKVLIVLGGKDMQDFSLKYNTLSFEDPHSGKILRRLLHLACDKTEISTKDKKILVEAIPKDQGCIILLTLLSNIKRKVYKIKIPKISVAYIFNTTENLINACIAIKNSDIPKNSSLYSYDGKFAIIFDNILKNKTDLSKLGEFSDIIISDKIQCAQIKEKGKLLITGNVIDILCRHFL